MDQRPYITCHELLDFLHLYLAGELPDERVHEFERHLGVCDPCVSYIESYKTATALGKAAWIEGGPDEPVGGSVPDELVAAILAARGGKAP